MRRPRSPLVHEGELSPSLAFRKRTTQVAALAIERPPRGWRDGKGPGPLGFQRFFSRADRVSIAAPAHDTPCVLNHASSRFQPSAA